MDKMPDLDEITPTQPRREIPDFPTRASLHRREPGNSTRPAPLTDDLDALEAPVTGDHKSVSESLTGVDTVDSSERERDTSGDEDSESTYSYSSPDFKEVLQDDFNQYKERKSLKKIILTILSIILVLTGLTYAGYRTYIQLTTTVVPQAIESIDPKTVEQKIACEAFGEVGLGCIIAAGTSDTVPRYHLIQQSTPAGERVENMSTITLTYSRGPAESVFPNMKGLTVAEAQKKIFDMGLEVGEITNIESPGHQENTIVSTSVTEGTTVKNGDKIDITVANGNVIVPDWTGKTRETVSSEARELGVKIVYGEEESSQPSGIILKQSHSGKVAIGDIIAVTVTRASESATVKLPQVVGKTSEEAQLELAGLGLQHITVVTVRNSDVSTPQVTHIVPDAGNDVSTNDNVVVIVSEPVQKDTPQSR